MKGFILSLLVLVFGFVTSLKAAPVTPTRAPAASETTERKKLVKYVKANGKALFKKSGKSKETSTLFWLATSILLDEEGLSVEDIQKLPKSYQTRLRAQRLALDKKTRKILVSLMDCVAKGKIEKQDPGRVHHYVNCSGKSARNLVETFKLAQQKQEKGNTRALRVSKFFGFTKKTRMSPTLRDSSKPDNILAVRAKNPIFRFVDCNGKGATTRCLVGIDTSGQFAWGETGAKLIGDIQPERLPAAN